MSYPDEHTDELHPFPMKRFERDGAPSSVETLRRRAARIADEARAQIDRYRDDVETQLRKREEELRARGAELDRKAAELDRRQQNLGNQDSENGWDQGYQDGFEAGREDGLAEGKKIAQAEWRNEFAQTCQKEVAAWTEANKPVLDKLADGLSGVRESLLAYWEKNILQIAAGIAHQTIARDLPKIREIPLDLLREALELAVGSASIKIRMNPEDLGELRGAAEAMLKEFSQITSAELLEDERIGRGGCVVESSAGTVDQRLESRLQRIIEELSR